jgi:glycosyltransferase involved in cell wall biosynthesis
VSHRLYAFAHKVRDAPPVRLRGDDLAVRTPSMTDPTDRRGLRFAMITTFYPPFNFGGDGAFVRRISHALARRGHEVDVIHDVDAFRILHSGPEPEALTEPDGVTVHALRSRIPGLSCLATQQTGRPLVHGRRIRKILDERQPDVIHYHNVSLVGGPAVLDYGDAIKLYMAHEHWLVCPMHVLWRHNRELCTGRECLRCALHYRRPPQLWRSTGLLEQKSKSIDVFYSPSHFSAGKHKEFGFARELEVLPSFLPDEEPADAAPPAPDPSAERPFFLFVGRLEKIKGLQEVIPLFGDKIGADLLIAGTGNYESELRKLAEGRPNVHFLGQLDPAKLRALYKGTLGVVVPSICFEGFPMVVLEAFRESAPIVARGLGPFPEIIEESEGGLIYNTVDELENALHRLESDAQLRTSLGRAGQAAFALRWSESVAIDHYLGVVARVADERNIPGVRERIVQGTRT